MLAVVETHVTIDQMLASPAYFQRVADLSLPPHIVEILQLRGMEFVAEVAKKSAADLGHSEQEHLRLGKGYMEAVERNLSRLGVRLNTKFTDNLLPIDSGTFRMILEKAELAALEKASAVYQRIDLSLQLTPKSDLKREIAHLYKSVGIECTSGPIPHEVSKALIRILREARVASLMME